jgi:hypothetical protein
VPTLTPGPADRELQKLIEIFLRAETAIINEIGRLRSRGLADYHVEAALERVQAILRNLENGCWTYVPRMIETQFYVHHPEARKPMEVPETPEKHLAGYRNARALTGEQMDIVQRLTANLIGQIAEADLTVIAGLESVLLGRPEGDIFRKVGLAQSAAMQATGRGVYKALPDFVAALRREGVTAFIDKAGRHWSLHTYGSMVLRTTSRQAEVLSVLTQNPDHDLYQISRHGTTCPLCAPLEGRVYSKSGRDPDFPPLSAAFGKMDKSGPDTLENSWLNIHPNCLHQLIRWTPMGRSKEELKKIKDFSSFEKNPVTRDPRTKKQIEAYRKKEAARARFLRDYRQWERYRETVGSPVPKRFETFKKHKYAVLDPETGKYTADDTFKLWESDYRKAKDIEKYSKVRYHEDGTVVVTDTWKEHRSIPSTYKPNAVVETRFPEKQIDRIFYDSQGRMSVQVHSRDHGSPRLHPYGQHGEHGHDFIRDETGKIIDRTTRELTDGERKENGDIL